MENNHFPMARYLKMGRMGRMNGCFHKLFIEPFLGKFTKNRVYPPHPPHFPMARYIKTVQVVQLNGCFHKLFIEPLLGKFSQNGGKPALLALFGAMAWMVAERNPCVSVGKVQFPFEPKRAKRAKRGKPCLLAYRAVHHE